MYFFHRIRKFLYYVVPALVFLSCGKENKIQLEELSQFSIDLPYRPLIYKSGIINCTPDSSLLYFYNPATYSRIDFFSAHQHLVKTVSLKKVKRKCLAINNIAVVSPDSIFILSDHTNQIFLIDGNGNVLNQRIFLDSSVAHFKLELTSSLLSGFLFNDDQLVFKCSYYPAERNNRFRNYYSYNRQSCYFASISIYDVFNPACKLKFHLKGFYNYFLANGDCNVEPPYYVFEKNNILMGSTYSDTVYILDRDFTLKHKIKLQSQYTPAIKCRPMRYNISGEDYLIGEDSLGLRQTMSAMISNITFDEFRKLYYFTIIHPVDPDFEEERKFIERRSSVLIYDTNFSFLQEVLIPKALTHEVFIRKDGLMWKLNDKDEIDHYKYALYNIKTK